MRTERDLLSAPAVVRLVAGREIRVRIRSAWFIGGTFITVLVIGVLVLMPRLFGGDDPKQVAVVGLTPAQHAALTADPGGVKISVRLAPDEAQARAWLYNAKTDATVIGASPPRITVAEQSQHALAGSLSTRLEQHAYKAELQRRGADVDAGKPAVSFLRDDSSEGQRVVFAYIVSLLLFSQIVGVGALVAQGVVEEKNTRVIEVLLAKVRPTPMLIGKVLGIGCVGLLQLFAIATAGVGMALTFGTLDIESTVVGVASTSLVWYVLGFVFYGFVYAAVGSIAAHPEELPGMTLPLQLVNTATLLIAVAGLQDIAARWLTLFSYLPPFSAVLVPMRMAGGQASLADIALPAIILAAATICAAGIGGRIYRRSITHLGGRRRLSGRTSRGSIKTATT